MGSARLQMISYLENQKHKKSKKITQKQLSDMTGISRNSISEMESGFMVIEKGQLQKIAKALGVSVNDLQE